MFWIVLAILLTVSSTLNAYQVVAAEDGAIQLWRGALSITLLFLGGLSLRKGLAERSNRGESTPGGMAEARATRRGMIPVLAIVILIVIAIGAAIARRAPGVSMPESLAGYSRVHNPTVDRFEQGFKSEVGGSSVVGVYGTAAQRNFIVAGFAAVPEPGTDMLRGFEEGFGATLDISSKTTRRIGPVTFTCVQFSRAPDPDGAISSNLCEWNDGETYGFVINLDPALDASVLAPEAYAAVVG